MAKDFLNSGILGANVSDAGGRVFRAIGTDNLPTPEYDGRFFETFPTVWANAYAFRKELEKGTPEAVEEWPTLFLLHYFGVLHLTRSTRRKSRMNMIEICGWLCTELIRGTKMKANCSQSAF